MERLAATDRDAYNAVEASIHVGRYAIALPFAAGRRVLDVACGEGYGAWLLAQAGATSVDAVDVSREAVERAALTFEDPRIAFATSTGEGLSEFFPPDHFDLVVSIETIEHVADPRQFLDAIKQVSRPDAVIVLTCPNDHWYYPPHEANPYHRRKYTFAEFQELTRAVLGDQVQWMLGSASLGFAAMPLAGAEVDQAKPLKIVDVKAADLQLRVAADIAGPKAQTASYFVGVWNAPRPLDGAGAFQVISMDACAAMMVAYPREGSSPPAGQHNSTMVAALRHENEILMERIGHFRACDAEQRTTIASLRDDCADLTAKLAAMTAERDDLLPAALRWRGLARRVKMISPGAAKIGARLLRWRGTAR